MGPDAEDDEANRGGQSPDKPAEPELHSESEMVPIRVNLAPDAYRALQRIAQMHSVNLTEALHRAIATELAVVEEQQRSRFRRK